MAKEIKIAKDLEELVNDTVEENPQALLDIQRGIRSAIDDLVVKVMKKCDTKVDPKRIRQLILSKL
jgi:Asp-tRNA(Asn)/Glu-tRNA(Gln) amidotransferase B subunit